MAIFDMNEKRGTAIASELGQGVVYQNVNVCDEASVQTGIDATLAAFGAIHLCSNSAGVADASKTVGKNGAFPLDLFTKVININLVGTFNVLRLVAEAMSKQEPVTESGCRGVIINTASVAALSANVPFPSRMGKPDAIAQLAQSIVENEYLNGEVIRCDGAVRMQPR